MYQNKVYVTLSYCRETSQRIAVWSIFTPQIYDVYKCILLCFLKNAKWEPLQDCKHDNIIFWVCNLYLYALKLPETELVNVRKKDSHDLQEWIQ